MSKYELLDEERRNERPQKSFGRALSSFMWRHKITVILLVIALVIYAFGYFNEREKHLAEKAEMQAEIDALQAKLDDRVAVFEEIDTKVDINVISKEIQEIGELASVEYLYTDAGQFSDPKQVFGVDIPFTTKSFIAKWDGVIKAGIDITRLSVEVNENTKTIVIHIPAAEILSHEIGDNIETLDENDGLFNPIRIDDIRTFDAESKEAMEQRAIDNGLLEKADENAQRIISGLLNANSVIKDNYELAFELLD